ncbi:MAG TPA: MlaD family protein [Chitinophagaceae bacterium]|nr:MlaD family protein [Chitinophagaceae bacterium]
MKISNETKVGVLVVVAIVLLILGFNLLKGNSIFSSDTTLYAVYDNIDGLAPSNPIILNGLQVGTVGSLNIMDQQAGEILVELTIKKDIEIPSNSVAVIKSDGLLGGKGIKLQFGNANTYLQSEDTIRSAVGSGIKEKLVSKIDPITNQVNTTLANLDSVLVAFHSILNVKTQENLQNSIKSLSETMQNFSQTSSNLSKLVNGLDDFMGNLNEQNQHINQIIANTEEATASLASADIPGTIEDLDVAVNNLNGILDKINTGNGSLGALINNDHLYKNIESASYNLNLLMEDLRLNPARYVHFSIFGGKSESKPLPSDTTLK